MIKLKKKTNLSNIDGKSVLIYKAIIMMVENI